MERVDLDALEAALAKATPGEWVRRNSAISACAIDSIAENGNSKYLGEFYGPDWVENAIFIAFAHNALPALIAELRELRKEAARARWCEEARAVELDSKTGIAPEVLEGLLPDSAWLAQREREAAAKAEAVAVKLLGQLADEHATGREPRQSYTTGYQDALFHTHDKIRERIAAAIDAARGGGQ